MSLHHYSKERHPFRFLPFWSNRGLPEQLEANQAEILSRADTLLDGIVMLVPQGKESQERLVREAVIHLKKAVMLVHGAFDLGDNEK